METKTLKIKRPGSVTRFARTAQEMSRAASSMVEPKNHQP